MPVTIAINLVYHNKYTYIIMQGEKDTQRTQYCGVHFLGFKYEDPICKHLGFLYC
jgi:hypothetical protein